MLKFTRLALLITTLMVLGSSPAHAAKPRDCVGPYILSSVNKAPGADGVVVSHIDGQLTVHTWKTGSGAIEFNVEATNYEVVEDPLAGSFINLVTRSASAMDEVPGPFQRIRFNVTTCTDDCTTKVKVCGRVAP